MKCNSFCQMYEKIWEGGISLCVKSYLNCPLVKYQDCLGHFFVISLPHTCNTPLICHHFILFISGRLILNCWCDHLSNAKYYNCYIRRSILQCQKMYFAMQFMFIVLEHACMMSENCMLCQKIYNATVF